MYSLRTGSYSDWGNLIMDEVIKLINIEAKREFQPGDLVRGFAKYKTITEIWTSTTASNKTSYTTTPPQGYEFGHGNSEKKTGSDIFNYIKGDTNIDNIASLNTGKPNESELIEGKVVSVSSVKGNSSIKVSFYNKNVNKYFVKELIPSTVTRKLKLADIAGKLPAVSITRQLFQDQHLSNPNKIPGYLTSDFIRHFTYSKKYDSGYLRQWLKYYGSWSDSAIDNINKSFDDSYSYADDIIGIFSKGGFKNTSFFRKNSNIFGNNSIFELSIIKRRLNFSKEIEYNGEENRFRELKIRWINELADAARKNEDPDKPEDPYNVMAKGVLDYWKSCAQQPLSKEPGAPPALFAAPQGGLYAPVYYGSQTMLGNNIKRAFNTGKRFSQSYEKQIAAKLVASALAYSFAMHLLELKFIYRGGIPGPNGPIPMIGFIPLVY